MARTPKDSAYRETPLRKEKEPPAGRVQLHAAEPTGCFQGLLTFAPFSPFDVVLRCRHFSAQTRLTVGLGGSSLWRRLEATVFRVGHLAASPVFYWKPSTPPPPAVTTKMSQALTGPWLRTTALDGHLPKDFRDVTAAARDSQRVLPSQPSCTNHLPRHLSVSAPADGHGSLIPP